MVALWFVYDGGNGQWGNVGKLGLFLVVVYNTSLLLLPSASLIVCVVGALYLIRGVLVFQTKECFVPLLLT